VSATPSYQPSTILKRMSAALSDAPFQFPAAPDRSDLVAKYFRTLADPTRLRILQLLREEGQLPVGAIAARLGVTQPGVSNHLACLRWCGFVATRREHRTVFNFIADERVLTLLEVGNALLDDNAEHVAACCQTEEGS
jgi:ArsR family transcriptional regulator, cadmium/lead-responsive transcriptional repressor